MGYSEPKGLGDMHRQHGIRREHSAHELHHADDEWNQDGTTPRTQALGEALKRTRTAVGVPLRELARRIGLSHTTVNRWETGERPPSAIQVTSYMSSLGASPAQRDELITLAREVAARHWLATDFPDIHRQIETLQEMEREATRIISFSQLLIPGQLQIEEYARAIIAAGDVSHENSEHMIRLRMSRRRVITREHPAHMVALLDRSALDRNIGGPEVMLAQVRFLLAQSEKDNVEVRIVPVAGGWHLGLSGEFMVVEFSNRTPVVHYENRRAGHLVHRARDVQLYIDAAEEIRNVAVTPAESSAIIREWIAAQEDTA